MDNLKQNIMEHIQDDGFGVPRLGMRKSVTTRASQHHTPSLKDGTERSLSRFLATGSCLLRARTVNELLMAVYDILEVHRTWLYGGNAVHSIPWCGLEDVPLTIGSLLARKPGDFRSLWCLIIDHDDASPQVGCDVNKPREPELPVQRTGTPMYVARSVCMREVLTDSVYRFIPPMPELSGEARALYVGAYGKERYERYNDNQETYHGARPPNPYQKLETAPPFRHRPEHDVESIYWTMVTALLRVRPENIDEHPEAAKLIVDFWTPLLLHRIPDTDSDYADPREGLLLRSDKAWRALFLGDMKDVGTLLGDISHQIRPEYAFCGDGPQRDHLHEAVQRLILQYLVEHEDIHLDPEHLRTAKTSTVARLFTPVFESSRAEAAGALGTFQNSSQTLVNSKTCGATERKSVERVSDATQSAERTNSSPSGTRVAARVP
ncbi:hypothetical protein LXA43DRAFT_317395 [Ganoderma leucocontextum]|nr:hypothetical protein LXA43DRAFT_317395 [Ganoderma leucocontextum]